MAAQDQNLLELVVKTIDQSTSQLQQIKTQINSLGDTAGRQTGQISQLELGLKQLEQQAEKTGKAAKTMETNLLSIRNLYFLSFIWSNLSYYGGQLIQSFVGLSTSAAQWNREMENVQTQFGFTNREAVGFQISLQEVGRSVGDVDQGMRMFTLRMYEATKGTGHGADAMARLGYSSKEAREIGLLPTGQSLDIVINRMQQLGSTAERNTIAVAMFGRSAVTMMPVVERGLEAGRLQADLFEVTMTKLEQLVSGRALDSFREFSRSAEALGRHLGAVSSEGLAPLANMASQTMEALSRHIKDAMPIIEEDFGMKTRDQSGGLGKWFADRIDQASKFLIQLHDTQKVLEVINNLKGMGPRSAGFDWDWGKMAFTHHDASPGASYSSIMDTIQEGVGYRIPRKGRSALGNGIFSGVVGGNLFSAAGVFEGAPAGPMTSLDQLQEIDTQFDDALQSIANKVAIKALTLQQALQQLATLLQHADNSSQVSRVNAMISNLSTYHGTGAIGNPYSYPGAALSVYAPMYDSREWRNSIMNTFKPGPSLDAVPGADLARAMLKYDKNGNPLSQDALDTNLRKSLKKEDIDQLNKSLDLSDDKLMKLVLQFDDWVQITDRMTNSMGQVQEEGLMMVAGLEAVRRNLFLGGNAMYDFAYGLAQGVAGAMQDGFAEAYKEITEGTFKLKNAMLAMFTSLINSVHKQMLESLSKLVANKLLSGLSGSGGGFNIMGLVSMGLGLINPALGVGAAIAGQVGGNLFGGGYHDPGGSGGWGAVSDTPLVGPPPATGGSNIATVSKGASSQVYVAPGAVVIQGGLIDPEYVKQAVTDSLAYTYNKAMAEGAIRGTY